MFDIGFFELVLVGIVGLLVLGPERLPHAVRMTSAYLGKIRRTVNSVKEEFEREVNLHEMQQRIKQQMEKAGLEETRQSLDKLKQDVETAAANTKAAFADSAKTGPTPENSMADSLPETEVEAPTVATTEAAAEAIATPSVPANQPNSRKA